MNFIKLLSYAKPILFWVLALALLCEVLLHFFLNDLPLKFLAHSTGPIHRLGQYSKKDVVPEKHIAIIGDSNVYGFGPWLYDNSWSLGQPSFATHHLMYEQTKSDVIAFGYPGFGTFGACLSSVAELNFISNSWIWPDLNAPQQILIVFYEGNDLMNNIREFEQRGINLSVQNVRTSKFIIKKNIKKEVLKLNGGWSLKDQFATWNIGSGLISNYFDRYFPTSIKVNKKDSSSISDDNNVTNKERKFNVALIDQKKIALGFCEGPSLLLNQEETSFALSITRESVLYVAKKFPSSKIHLVYLPSALSIYNFGECQIKPAPITMNGKLREQTFSQSQVYSRNEYLRIEISQIAQDCSIGFIDTTPPLKIKGHYARMHGPRDPIHFNRQGYYAFADTLMKAIKN